MRGWVADGNRLIDYPDAESVDGSILAVECDIAVPAALEGTITDDIASKIRARLVVEGANGLQRLDATLDLVSTASTTRWRDHALGIAISRVIDGMTLAGQVSANHGPHRLALPAT